MPAPTPRTRRFPPTTSCFGTGCHKGTDLSAIHASAETTVAGVARRSCLVCHADGVPPSRDCTTCHTAAGVDYHTGQDAAHVSATTSELLRRRLPRRLQAPRHRPRQVRGHGRVVLAVRDLVRPVPQERQPDPHRLDTAGPNERCTGECHAGSHGAWPPSEHAVTAASASCTTADCHGTDITSIHGAYDDLTRCGICHDDKTNWSKTADCVSCHDTANPHPTQDASHTATVSSADFTIDGVDYGTKPCADCHALPLLTDTHSGTCKKCHPSPKNTLTPAWDKTCAQGGCHTAGSTAPMHASIDASHAPEPGLDCFDAGCHETLAGKSLAGIHESASTTVAGNVVTSCMVCHTGGKPAGSTCADAGCHGDIEARHESGSHGVTETVAACLGNCHDADLQVEHARSVGGRTPVGCMTCHTTKVDGLVGGWDGTCYACHDPQHSDMQQSGNGRCIECHGTDPAPISQVATDGTYANTGGDHSAGYDVSAHGSAVAAGNDGGVSTGVQCEACHSHKSGNDALTDYRTAGLSPAGGGYSGLCYRCHSSESTEATSAGSAPYSWNGRDVKAEFARASSHPVFSSAPATASVAETLPVFSQSTKLEFESSSFAMTSNLLDGGPQLFWGEVPMRARANQSMMFLTDKGGTQQYDLDINGGLPSWNDDGFNPPDLPAGSEPLKVFRTGDRLFALVAMPQHQIWEYTLPNAGSAGAWSVVATLPTSGGTLATPGGADAVYDEQHGMVYIIPANGSDKLYCWDVGGRSLTQATIADSTGAPIQLSSGAALALSETPHELWFIRSLGSGTPDQGMLYRMREPSGESTVTGTSTGLWVGGWWEMWSGSDSHRQQPGPWNNYRMVRYRVGGVDKLYILGRWQYGVVESSQITVSNLDTTPSATYSNSYPWTTVANGDYTLSCDMEWDGGSYVYVTNGAIPAYPSSYGMQPGIAAWFKRLNVNTGAWETLTPPAGYNGGQVAFATATPPAGALGTGYAMAGTVVSPEITPMTDAVAWGTVTYAATVPSGTAVSVKVQGKSDGAWADVPGFENVVSGDALTGVGIHDYEALRLVALLSTTNQASLTPQLTSWAVSAAHPVIAEPATDTQIAKADRGVTVNWTDVHDATSTVGQAIQIPLSAQAGWNRQILYVTNGIGTYVAYDPAFATWNPWSYYRFAGSSVVTGSAAFTSADNKAYFTVPPGSSGDLSMLAWGARTSDRVTKEGTGTADTVGIMPTGGDAAYDASRNVAFVAQASLVQNPIWRWKPGVGPLAPMTLSEEMWRAGNAMAYAPKADRLFLWMFGYEGGLYSRLNYVNAPASVTGTATIVNAAPKYYDNGGPVTYVGYSGATALNTKLAVFEANGREYMASYGGWAYSTYPLTIWGDLSASPGNITRRNSSLPMPSGWPSSPNLAPGGDLKWDGGEYLYLIYGNAGSQSMRFARIKIPSNPMVDSWPAWEALPSYYTTYGGGSMTFVKASGLQTWQTLYTPEIVATDAERAWTSVSYTASIPTSATLYGTLEGYNGTAWTALSTQGYFYPNTTYTFATPASTATYPKLRIRFDMSCMDGQGSPVVTGWTARGGHGESTWVTTEARPSPGSTHWESAYQRVSQPIGTSVKMTLQGWDGTQFVDIPGFVDRTDSMMDIRSLSIRQWPRLRLRGSYSVTTYGTNPALDNWWITSSKQTVQYASSLSCVSCHNTHVVQAGGTEAWDAARVSDPAGARGTFAQSTSTDMTQFCLKCHGSSQVVRAVDTATNVPYTIAFSSPSGPYFTSWLKGVGPTAFGLSGHQTTSGTKAGCETCHDPHGSDNAALNAWTRPSDFTTGVPGVRDNTVTAASEENLCFQCHGNGTLGVQAPGAQDVASSIVATYGHPAAAVRGKHSDSESAVELGVPNRHAECVDCHDPHAAQPGTHVAGTSQPGGALLGATGVKPKWDGTNGTTAASYEPMRITGAPGDAEAYVCFKCHTNATLLPAQATASGIPPTDLAMEFNPSNASFHNVLGLSGGVKTTFTVNGTTVAWPFFNTLKAPWAPDSGMSCSDCHTSEIVGQAKGPHGSSVKFMIDPNYPDYWADATLDANSPTGVAGNIICSKCHTLMGDNDNWIHRASGISATRVHSNWSMGCRACHVAVPHGWKRPRLLGVSTDPEPYRTKTHNTKEALKKISVRSRPTGSWQQADCEVGCSSTHRSYPAPSNYWP